MLLMHGLSYGPALTRNTKERASVYQSDQSRPQTNSCNLSLATDSGYYVFLFITLYKNPYLDLVKILSGGWDNIFAGTSYSS